jgi:hypothetical protein
MPKHVLRTLRGQLLLLAGLFALCVLAAVVIASQRAVFEQFIAERYQPLPAELQLLTEAVATGSIDQEVFATLSPAQRLALYDTWMTHPAPPPPETPRALVAADPAPYLARAERSLVTGRLEQKLRAVMFLELAGSRQALPILRKAHHWAARRHMPELATRIAVAMARLQDIPEE